MSVFVLCDHEPLIFVYNFCKLYTKLKCALALITNINQAIMYNIIINMLYPVSSVIAYCMTVVIMIIQAGKLRNCA